MEKYPIALPFTERDISIIVYREYQKRYSLYQRQDNLKKFKEWGEKVNKMVVLFNRIKVENAEPLNQISTYEQKEDVDSLIAYAKQEVNNRLNFYPSWIRLNKITYDQAYYNVQGMKAVFNLLIDLKVKVQGKQSALF